MPRERDNSRERSPVSYDTTNTRRYRDRSDAPTKRKHRDASNDVTLPGPVKKKIQPAVQNREKQNYPSVNELKRRIRDVKRLLSRGDLAADARIVQERALAGYEKDLEDETQRRARSQMIKKYHFVRFLDRKSATKNINRLLRREKDLASSERTASKSIEDDLESLRRKIHIARVNLNYTIYYPLNDKYISLYANEQKHKHQHKESDDDTHSGADNTATQSDSKPPLWYTIEKCMQEGTLDLLRDGKLSSTGEAKGDTRTEKRNKDSKKSRQEAKRSSEKTISRTTLEPNTSGRDGRKDKHAKRGTTTKIMRHDHVQPAADDDDDESDGGFFEK